MKVVFTLSTDACYCLHQGDTMREISMLDIKMYDRLKKRTTT